VHGDGRAPGSLAAPARHRARRVDRTGGHTTRRAGLDARLAVRRLRARLRRSTGERLAPSRARGTARDDQESQSSDWRAHLHPRSKHRAMMPHGERGAAPSRPGASLGASLFAALPPALRFLPPSRREHGPAFPAAGASVRALRPLLPSFVHPSRRALQARRSMPRRFPALGRELRALRHAFRASPLASRTMPRTSRRAPPTLRAVPPTSRPLGTSGRFDAPRS